MTVVYLMATVFWILNLRVDFGWRGREGKVSGNAGISRRSSVYWSFIHH